MFRICSEFSVIFRIFRHFSEFLAQKLVYSESLDFVVMVKLIDKAIVINVKIYKNEREKSFIRAIKKIYLVETKVSMQISKFLLMKFQVKIKSQI
jgi:hypothetical protein